MSKKVNIIGAGIAGLSAGCYLQMNGYDTEIFEMHNLPGGLCTSWKREGYTFDGCIHVLPGTVPADDLYHIWNELIDMKKIEILYYDEYQRVEDTAGNRMSIFTDADKMEREFLEKAPEDKELILDFTNAVRRLAEPDSFMEVSQKWGPISAGEYAARCKSPLLRETFMQVLLPEMSLFFYIILISCMHNKSAGYPIGGSLKFSRLFEKKYLELGGKISYNSRVEKIETRDNKAVGIVLKNGETRPADIVISAADGHYTIFEMLEGKFVDEEIKGYYDNIEVTPSYVQVSLGVEGTFPDLPHLWTFPLEEPLVVDDKSTENEMTLTTYNFDPTSAPQDKTVLVAGLTAKDYRYWQELREKDKKKYEAEKKRLAGAVIDILDKKLGNIKSRVEVVDVATPATIIRYTNNWQGSPLAWKMTTKTEFKPLKNTLPGLEDFYMAGHWTDLMGGLATALTSGRSTAGIICEKDNKEFRTAG